MVDSILESVWGGKQVVSKDWVRESITPHCCWLRYRGRLPIWFQMVVASAAREVCLACLGFDGQKLMVFPEERLIVVFTGWGS
jgi:hypothetical protein